MYNSHGGAPLRGGEPVRPPGVLTSPFQSEGGAAVPRRGPTAPPRQFSPSQPFPSQAPFAAPGSGPPIYLKPGPAVLTPAQTQWQAPLTDPFGGGGVGGARAPTVEGARAVARAADTEEEGPLLQELGIVPKDIARRMLCVLTFQTVGHELVESMDMTGPVLILMALGSSLLISGKVHFGHVYAMMSAGTLALWALLNMMARTQRLLSLHRALSVFGYGLLPILLSSMVTPFLRQFKLYVVVAAVVWSTLTAARFVDEALQMKEQRLLVAYPILLFYGCFALTL